MMSASELDNTKEQVMDLMKQRFKPEFLNRIDETVFFKALNMNELSQIVDIQMEYLQKLLTEKEINIKISPDAKELLATKGFNPLYGARPLKRTIRQLIENPLSKKILMQEIKPKDTVLIDSDGDKIVFKKKK